MIQITDKAKCSGCTACYNSCLSKCISMEPDEEGFLYPVIDQEKCIDCGLCERACPVINPPRAEESARRTFAVRSNDADNLSRSTSGGMFLPLLSWTFQKNGVMCAAGYDDSFGVVHMIADSQEQGLGGQAFWDRFRGSKYVQSDLGEVFARLKALLEEGRTVCFIGTPCQVNGLKTFLGREYRGLYTVDLVCHGVASPKLWGRYLAYRKEKNKSEIQTVSFRSKIFGYHSGGMMHIFFTNGKEYCASGRVDFMLKSFFKEIISRPICYDCPFKQLERCSDLTLYDCKQYHVLTGQSDDDKGYTNVIVQSKKGHELFTSLKEQLQIAEVDTEKAIELCGVMVRNSAKKHPKRDEFYKCINSIDYDDFEQAFKRFVPVRKKDHFIEISKQILYRVGVLQMIRKWKLYH